jgi:hypothetical protein
MKSLKIRLTAIAVGLLFLSLAVPGFSQGQDGGQTSNNNEPEILKFFGDGPGKWIVLAIAFAICKGGGAFGKIGGTNTKPTDNQSTPKTTDESLEGKSQVPPPGVTTGGESSNSTNEPDKK